MEGPDGKSYTLGLFDTSGNDMDVMRPLAYPDAKVFVIYFSLVDRNSFTRVKTKWVPEIRQSGNKLPIVLVGNKIDLRDSGADAITTEEGNKMSSDVGAVAYLECSAKTLQGLGEVFERVVEAAVKGN
jgi:Ras-related C3 botulinum toxin substrate 1